MNGFSATFAAAAAAIVLGAGAASATVLDFTDPADYTIAPANVATGTVDGISFELVATGGRITEGSRGPGAIGSLEGITDGLGIAQRRNNDDELSYPSELFTLTFGSAVKVVNLMFLDLFGDGESLETALVSVDGAAPSAFMAQVDKSVDSIGYGSFATSLTGSVFTFSVASPDDNSRGMPDYALAGLEIAPIPLPAGAFLLGGALLGLGALRRRNKTA